MGPNPRVRRRAQACARCRSRKVHCDALPSGCSLCAAAGVLCVSVNPATNQAVPRSIAQFLEARIAEREKEREVHSANTGSSKSRRFSKDDALPQPRHQQAAYADPAVTGLLNTITPPFLGLSSAVPLARCVVAGTRLPSAQKAAALGMTTTSDIHEQHPKSIVNRNTQRPGDRDSYTPPLTLIPVHVADFLFANYVNRVAPQYPIHYVPDLTDMHRRAFHQTDADGNPRGATVPYDVFTLNLVMAISLSTAARSKQARANAIATGLYEKAMEQIPHVLSNDLRGLQALVLLTQYAFLNPGVANFWLLTGFISQACIDLGLHHELPADGGVSFLERDMRRRVFWCAWEMEVAVCGALLRPITLLRRTITAEFPSQLEDTAITPTGIVDPPATGDGRAARRTKFTSRLIWRYREIECDIVPVLFHDEPVPPEFPSLEAWMRYQERAILDWKAEIHQHDVDDDEDNDPLSQSQWDEMRLYSSIATDYILVTLFRPCPRLRDPPASNLLRAFSAAAGVADGSWRQANEGFGSSKYVFHACYHSFSAAVTFLQALQRIKPRIFAAYTRAEVRADMDTFSRFFATVAERWPAAARCLEEYERLLAPIEREVDEFFGGGAVPSLSLAEEVTSGDHDMDSIQTGATVAAAAAAATGTTTSVLATNTGLDPGGSGLEEAFNNFGTFFHGMMMQPPGLAGEDDRDELLLGGFPGTLMDWEGEFNFDLVGQGNGTASLQSI